MSRQYGLPPRGAGLLMGAAGSRRYGFPRSPEQRLERHRMQRAAPLATQTRRLHDNQKLNIPHLWGCNQDIRRVSVVWDTAKTVITDARLRARVFSDDSLTYFDYYLNNEPIIRFDWGLLQAREWREDEKSVSAHLFNGDNYFKAQFCKAHPLPLSPSCLITGDLALTYEGEPPSVTPPTPPAPDIWETLKWLAVAGVAIGGIYVAYKVFVPREKPVIVMREGFSTQRPIQENKD